jgi:SsrA-binding protein
MEVLNRKAKFEYQIIQEFEAGIQLSGSEVKSLRAGMANMTDAWCLFENGQLYIKNLHISEYKQAMVNHEPKRTRKLLLRKPELRKIERKSKEKGYSIVPLRIFFSETGYAKCDIALAQGKKAFDKRQSIKQKDMDRDMARLKKIR